MFYKGNEDREKRLRFSIRKVSFGAASVAVAALFMFPGNGTVSATEQGVTPTNEGRQGSPLKDPDVQNGTYGATPVVNQLDGNSGSSETTAPKGQEETSTTATPAPVVSSPASVTEEAEEKATPDLDKKQLEDYVAEIDAKLASGSYATKTDESVATLKEHLELAKLALTTAKSQDELTKAYRKLLMTASSGLRNKPKAQVESPKLDTTEGKATVGKKASTTDKATGTNSIANSGQHDPRNGQALDRNNPFRTDGTTTDTDPDANQTYTLPGDSANLKEVANSLINLPTKITNETKITSINEVGALQKIAPGEVKDINEFGGWKATSGGVFAIARRTDKGVFPIETVNTVLVQNGPYRTWLNESTFDRSKDYALFLAEVRTKATEEEAVDDGSVYVAERHYANKGIGLAKFKGIEKTFKAYSKSTGSDVIVSFKTGFTGDIDGKKAKYRVEVFAKDESGTTRTIYDQIFSPNENREDETKKVVAPIIGRDQYFDTNRASLPTRETLNEKLEQDPNKRRLGTSTGTFTSKGIVLEPNVTEYTVRISPGDNANLGMGYQVPWKQYALPISGLGFTLEQDTSRVAKALLQRVYNKLKETEEKDTKGKTEATINDYRTQLENVNKLLTGDLKKTQDYKDIVTTVLAAQQALRTDKSKLDTANTKLLNLINENPDPRIGKTLTSITSYDFAKTEAINAQTEAQKILNQDNPDPDVVATIASELNEKLAELKIARAELVDKATEEQKTKLEADAGKLTKASTEGKTQDSITAYNEKYAQLATELEAAKTEAEKVLAKENNATKEEVTAAQAKVDAVKAELDKAVELLKDLDREAAKKEIADAAKTATDAIEASTSFTPEQKAEEKVKVAKEATDATDAIDKATTEAELDKALRTFLYQMDQDSLVYERPSFDLEAFIQSSITGVVTVERGKAIHQADIIAKLNLPESITVISIDLPDTNTLGDKFAKVMLRLADGKEITVKVPVRVVASQSGESKPETSLPDYGRNNGSTNTDAKVDKAKLEGAIRQLDELIIKESAKLDAETAKEANDLLADAKKVFANADASQAEVDAMVKRIEDFMAKVSPSTDHATPANDQAAQTPAVAPANASQTASAQANARKAAKELPNTGTADSTVAMVAAAASALLGLGLAGRRRKEDEEA
ncbi:YSIRK-type signal peptide-containing protein [Streptococcus sp. UMB1203]|nr:YSIRK-type signal peptide-containing protein [Streptococcus sp. UMB1203]